MSVESEKIRQDDVLTVNVTMVRLIIVGMRVKHETILSQHTGSKRRRRHDSELTTNNGTNGSEIDCSHA